MKSINSFIENQELLESWDYFSRTIYIHKLLPPTGKDTLKSIDALVEIGVLHDPREVYIYSFIHPDSNSAVSFAGPIMLKPKVKLKVWYTLVSPLRGFLYKGHDIGRARNTFSSEMIQQAKLDTTAFLFTGETNRFQKVGEIPCEAISTTLPSIISRGPVSLYENIRFKCDANKYGINSIQFKKFKFFVLPQILTKANYMFVYNCIVN
jgi:hypothetical protein